jgi:hypothetical protein
MLVIALTIMMAELDGSIANVGLFQRRQHICVVVSHDFVVVPVSPAPPQPFLLLQCATAASSAVSAHGLIFANAFASVTFATSVS